MSLVILIVAGLIAGCLLSKGIDTYVAYRWKDPKWRAQEIERIKRWLND